jgi:hypothetical protein
MLYSTASVVSWLRWLLMRPEIVHHLDSAHVPHTQDGSMWHTRDSPAWQSLPGNYTSRKYNLVFSLYVDWFNPYGNQIGGKSISCGTILLTCLNLAPNIARANSFFAGLMPPPKAANVNTIHNLTDPVINKLRTLFNGVTMPTADKPGGTLVRAVLLPTIADLGAIRKLSGFVGHMAMLFCSFCKCPITVRTQVVSLLQMCENSPSCVWAASSKDKMAAQLQ